MLDYSILQLIGIVVLALMAGVLGGLLGVGGSVIMIPGLVILLGRPHGIEQHLYQAAAMVANVAVAIPAAFRHRKAGAMVPKVVRWMLPAALVAILIGVWVSNLPLFAGPSGGVCLGRVLAGFLIYVIVVNLLKLRHRVSPRKPQDAEEPEGRPSAAGGLTVGALMGTAAGLMGIGGGAIAVPLQQTLMNLPLRRCIANSSAVICVSAAVGAIYKNVTLSQHAVAGAPITWKTGLMLGLMLAPSAWLGGRLGAGLTHRLPLRAIRLVFITLMLVAAWRMAAV